MTILWIIFGLIAFVAIVIQVFFIYEGDAKLVVYAAERTPFEIEARDDNSITLSSQVEFANVGKQCSTVMDCFVRTLLPFEQYDGIDARAKAQRVDEPREDDYFEAVLVEPGESITVKVFVKLTARKDLTVNEALSHMVDLPMDIVYSELSRRPWRLKKVRIVMTAEELAKLAGVQLIED